MQVATQQAARALAALRSQRRRGATRRRRSRPSRMVAPTTLDRAVLSIESQPRVRTARVAAARTRVAGGAHPSAADVADMIVRRSICDRLR